MTDKLKQKKYEDFCDNVEIILLTVNSNEYGAAKTFMKAPFEGIDTAILDCDTSTVVGMFAKKKTALIQADGNGDKARDQLQKAIERFSAAKVIIAVGVCYAFEKDKIKFGDVIVSKQIAEFSETKFEDDGRITNRGDTERITGSIVGIFHRNKDVMNFQVSKAGRKSKVFCGKVVSYNTLVNNKILRDRVKLAAPEAIGGEMEGCELLRLKKETLKKKRQIEIVIIKGVSDYADGAKTKHWQFTAAMAALTYTETKLRQYSSPGKILSLLASEAI